MVCDVHVCVYVCVSFLIPLCMSPLCVFMTNVFVCESLPISLLSTYEVVERIPHLKDVDKSKEIWEIDIIFQRCLP